MGKISEALEKANRFDGPRLSDRKRKAPEKTASEKPAIESNRADPSLRDIAADRPPADKAEGRKPAPTQTAATTETTAAREAAVKPAPEREKPKPIDIAKKSPASAIGTVSRQPVSKPVEFEEAQATTQKPRPAAPPLPREQPVSPPEHDVVPPPAAAPQRHVSRPERREKNLRIHYSRTKVQSIDPERLRDNKVISIFDDIEATEQIKILRTQVLKKLKALNGNSILVTSANPYEGKTFTSINLGISLAKEFDRTVLIIDADMRKPTKQHTAFSTDFFSIDVDVGLTDYLKGEAEIPSILINPGINKLTLIPAGNPVDNAPELLSSPRMEEMMADIKSRYASDRLVIVDGPAMLPFPDAMILARYVDGVLPVVEIGRTPVDQLKKMMNNLKEFPILGTVMNKNRDS